MMIAHQKQFSIMFVKSMVKRTCLGISILLIAKRQRKPFP